MSRPVRWSNDALADLAELVAYIAADNPSAARRVADAVDKTALALGDMPIGRPGRVTGTYEKSVIGLVLHPRLRHYADRRGGRNRNCSSDPHIARLVRRRMALTGPAGPKLRNRTNFRTYCERGLCFEGFSLKFRRELRGGGYFDGEYWL